MKRAAVCFVFLLGGIALGLAADNAAEPRLSEHLKPFAPYLGKTWKGQFVGSASAQPIHDVSRWERALNGNAIRITHSVNEGQYGGESIVMWDPKAQSLVAWYFTTAGFFTQGTMKFENGKWISHEKVTGEQGGITEVKGESTLTPEGKLHTKAQFLKNGQWVDGHEIVYTESPESKVIFR